MCIQRDEAIYKTGINLSRNFNKNTNKETTKLYDIIKYAINIIQNIGIYKQRRRDKAISFITELYEPLIRKVSAKIYYILKSTVDYEDILQETYSMFLVLLDKYDPERASFSYYINTMLPQHMNRWAEKESNYRNINIPVNVSEYVIVDPLLSDSEQVFDRLNAFLISKEYTKFVQHRSKKQSRSDTVRIVCEEYFLGKNSCSDIARQLNISYNAVYEIINKIKRELCIFFSTNKYCSHVLSSTGIILT